MYIPYIDLEIKVIILSKRGKVVQDLRRYGRIEAVKRYNQRYKCGLKVALDYIRKVEGEMK